MKLFLEIYLGFIGAFCLLLLHWKIGFDTSQVPKGMTHGRYKLAGQLALVTMLVFWPIVTLFLLKRYIDDWRARRCLLRIIKTGEQKINKRE